MRSHLHESFHARVMWFCISRRSSIKKNKQTTHNSMLSIQFHLFNHCGFSFFSRPPKTSLSFSQVSVSILSKIDVSTTAHFFRSRLSISQSINRSCIPFSSHLLSRSSSLPSPLIWDLFFFFFLIVASFPAFALGE